MRILIAANDERCLTRLASDVTGWGYKVVLARDGEEAWHFLQDTHGPRVALLEDALPKVTGVEVCRRLRRRQSAPLVYVVLLTAAHEGQDPIAALEAGADDRVCLPYREDELRARVGVGVRLVKQYKALARRLSSIEESLREFQKREDQLRILTDSLPVLMTYVDAGQRHRFSTRHFEDWSGQPCAAFLGKHHRELLGEEAYRTIRQHIDAALSGQRVTFEDVIPYRFPGKRYVRVTYIPDLADGKTRGLFCFVQDLTEPLQLLGRTGRLHADLARAERLAWLGAMTAALAHELSQPLAAILSNAQAALRFLNAEPQDLCEVEAILKDIVQADHRAGDVIRSLREYAKQDGPHDEILQVNTLVSNAVRLTRSDAILNQVAVVENLAADLPLISGDEVQVQQVVLNLLRNAIEAVAGAPLEQRMIVVSTSVGKDGSAQISVRDRGPGIPVDRLETLFEPLQTMTIGGRGIGLVVSQTIVTWHGGRIWAENNPEGGATFWVEFPPAS